MKLRVLRAGYFSPLFKVSIFEPEVSINPFEMSQIVGNGPIKLLQREDRKRLDDGFRGVPVQENIDIESSETRSLDGELTLGDSFIMPLNFRKLRPQIERALRNLEREFRRVKGLILTEADLQFLLYQKLINIPELSRPISTQDQGILGSFVHAELSWYDAPPFNTLRRLGIRPDLTILDPACLSILHDIEPIFNDEIEPYFFDPPYNRTHGRRRRGQLAYLNERPLFDPFAGTGSFSGLPSKQYSFGRLPRKQYSYGALPGKQHSFEGQAITFELKFARRGIDAAIYHEIIRDYRKMMRLFSILDAQSEGHTLYSYLVIFDKYRANLQTGPFARFLEEHREGPRHKIIYKSANVRRL